MLVIETFSVQTFLTFFDQNFLINSFKMDVLQSIKNWKIKVDIEKNIVIYWYKNK